MSNDAMYRHRHAGLKLLDSVAITAQAMARGKGPAAGGSSGNDEGVYIYPIIHTLYIYIYRDRGDFVPREIHHTPLLATRMLTQNNTIPPNLPTKLPHKNLPTSFPHNSTHPPIPTPPSSTKYRTSLLFTVRKKLNSITETVLGKQPRLPRHAHTHTLPHHLHPPPPQQQHHYHHHHNLPPINCTPQLSVYWIRLGLHYSTYPGNYLVRREAGKIKLGCLPTVS